MQYVLNKYVLHKFYYLVPNRLNRNDIKLSAYTNAYFLMYLFKNDKNIIKILVYMTGIINKVPFLFIVMIEYHKVTAFIIILGII